MHRARSADRMSDDGDEGAAEKEAEFQRLQRDYRVMKGDQLAFTEQMQVKINRQKKQIDVLDQEREELESLLALAEGVGNQRRDQQNETDLREKANKKDELEEKIREEKRRHEDLDAKIREWEQKIKKQLKSMGGAFLGAEHTQKTQRQLRVLENRLDNALKRFNTVLTQNSLLRKQIDSLRYDRNRFEQVYEKLEKERVRLRQDIGKVIEESTQSYEQREEAQQKMVTMKEKNEKELAQHNAEMKELVRIIDHEHKLREFMNRKGQGRQEDPQLRVWKEKQQSEAEQKRAELSGQVQRYDEAFERIKELTNEQELDRLVSKFIEKEDANFALFNYVNEQNNRIEDLQEMIQHIKKEMRDFEANSALVEEERAKKLRELERKQKAISAEADECEQSIIQVSKIIDQLRTGIESLFTKLECDRSTLEEMLGPQEVTEDNMLQFLGVIEQKTNDLLITRAYLDFTFQKEDERYDPKTHRLLAEVPAPAQLGTVVPPSLGDEFEAEDEEREFDAEANRPLSRKALELRVMRNVRRREVAIAKAEQQHANRFGGTSGIVSGEPSTAAAGGFGAGSASQSGASGGDQAAPTRRLSGQVTTVSASGAPASSSRPASGPSKESASGSGAGAGEGDGSGVASTTAAPPLTPPPPPPPAAAPEPASQPPPPPPPEPEPSFLTISAKSNLTGKEASLDVAVKL